MPIESCNNCERTIGKLEQAHVYKGSIVCKECNESLRNPKRKSKKSEYEIDVNLPTEKQIRYAEHLGIKIPKKVTKWELSALIDQAVQQRDDSHVRIYVEGDEEPKKRSRLGKVIAVGLIISAGVMASYEHSQAASTFAIAAIIVYISTKIVPW